VVPGTVMFPPQTVQSLPESLLVGDGKSIRQKTTAAVTEETFGRCCQDRISVGTDGHRIA